MITKTKIWLINITIKLLSAKIKIKHMKNRSQLNLATSRTPMESINIVFRKEISLSMTTRPTSPNKKVNTTSMSIKLKVMIHTNNHLTPT
jgi:hypothetical protein